MTYDVVIPTVGRPSLARLLDALAGQPEPLPGRIWLVDDRPNASPGNLYVSTTYELPEVEVLHAFGRGPAAARNAGWRASDADWIAFSRGPKPSSNPTSTPSAIGTTRISEKMTAASKLKRRIGCSVISAANSGFMHIARKEPAFSRSARYSGRYRPA